PRLPPYLPSFPTRRSSDLFLGNESRPGRDNALVQRLKNQCMGIHPYFRKAYGLFFVYYSWLLHLTKQLSLLCITSVSYNHRNYKDRKSTRLNSSHVKISYA